MEIYVLKPEPDRYQALEFVREDDWDPLLDRFNGQPMSASWTPLEVRVLREKPADNRRLPGDFPSLGGLIPVFSARAAEALRSILEPRGELLPLTCAEGVYYAYNVTRIVDALDVGRSEVKRFREGGIMRIVRHEFRPEALSNEVLFKIPSDRLSAVYVTEQFAERARAAGLVGLRFAHVWSARNS